MKTGAHRRALSTALAILLLGHVACRGSSPRPAPVDALATNDGPTPRDGLGSDVVDPAPADAGSTGSRPDRQKVLADLVRLVVMPAYAELSAEAGALATALALLRTSTSPETLAGARQRWRQARAVWRRSNAFGIGPADDLAITAGILDEPTNPDRLEALLVSPTALDATALRSLPANLRGLLALEHLLFDPEAADEAMLRALTGEAGQRRALYLQLLGEEIAGKTAAVLEAWRGRFAAELEQAGRGSSLFARERDAYDALLNKARAITDRTIDSLRSAAGGPAGAPPPLALRSDNVVPDLLDDLRGLEALYTGGSGVSAGGSLAGLVRDLNPPADARMRQALADALGVLPSVPRPVRTAGVASEPVTRAISALRAVKAALVTGVFSALGIGVGFSDNDGD